MSEYTVSISNSAKKQIEKAPRDLRPRLQSEIDSLGKDPRPPGVEKMSNRADHYRVRVGGWRIIYTVYDKHLEVEVVEVGDRKEVYRQR